MIRFVHISRSFPVRSWSSGPRLVINKEKLVIFRGKSVFPSPKLVTPGPKSVNPGLKLVNLDPELVIGIKVGHSLGKVGQSRSEVGQSRPEVSHMALKVGHSPFRLPFRRGYLWLPMDMIVYRMCSVCILPPPAKQPVEPVLFFRTITLLTLGFSISAAV